MELQQPKVLVRPHQFEETKGKNIFIGEIKPGLRRKELAREVAYEDVVWTSQGPLPRRVPGLTTVWALGTTRLVRHGTRRHGTRQQRTSTWIGRLCMSEPM
jgi:hypothetical protein